MEEPTTVDANLPALQSLEQEYQSLVSEKQHIERQNTAALKHRIDVLTRVLDQTRAELEETKQREREGVKLFKNIKGELELQTQISAKLQHKVDSLPPVDATLKALHAEVLGLKRQLAEQDRRHLEEKRLLSGQVAELSRNVSFQQEHNELQSNTSSAVHSTLQNELSEVTSELSQARSREAQGVAKLRSLQQELALQTEAHRGALATIASLRRQAGELQGEQAAAAAVRQQLQSERQQTAALREQVSTMQQQLDDSAAALQQHASEKAALAAQSRGVADSLARCRRQAAGGVDGGRVDLPQLMALLQTQLVGLEAQRAEACRQLKEVTQREAQGASKITALSRELTLQTVAHQRMQRQLSALSAQLAEARAAAPTPARTATAAAAGGGGGLLHDSKAAVTQGGGSKDATDGGANPEGGEEAAVIRTLQLQLLLAEGSRDSLQAEVASLKRIAGNLTRELEAQTAQYEEMMDRAEAETRAAAAAAAAAAAEVGAAVAATAPAVGRPSTNQRGPSGGSGTEAATAVPPPSPQQRQQQQRSVLLPSVVFRHSPSAGPATTAVAHQVPSSSHATALATATPSTRPLGGRRCAPRGMASSRPHQPDATRGGGGGGGGGGRPIVPVPPTNPAAAGAARAPMTSGRRMYKAPLSRQQQRERGNM